MVRFPIGFAMAIALVSQAGLTGCASTSLPSADSSPEKIVLRGPAVETGSILAARNTLNRALADRDVTAFARLWRDDLRSIVGGNGGMTSGREQNIEAYRRMFAEPFYLYGRRIPERIEVGQSSSGDSQAAESGKWVWQLLRNGTHLSLEGRYVVFWRKDGADWKILQETYVTTACEPAPSCGP